MHKDVEAVFPLYSFEIWEYMHIKGLNAQFGYVFVTEHLNNMPVLI